MNQRSSDDTVFKHPNILQADAGIGLNPGDVPASIRCPHCRHLGQFTAIGQVCAFHKSLISGRTRPFKASMRICPNINCHGLVFVLLDNSGETVALWPPELIDFNTDNLPACLVTTLSEAIACHAAGAYRAAALMVRRLLEELCDENGMMGSNLHQRITALKSKILISEALYDAMWELKALGNDAAHVDAKDYDQIGREESADSIELTKEILKAVYQHKSLVDRLAARKKSAVTQLAP